MRVTRVMGAALLVVASASAVHAELKSGVPVGGKITPYKGTKCGGADDGVELGKPLCYT